MTLSLTAIGPVLAAHPPDYPKQLSEAFSLGLLWAQRVARKTTFDIATRPYFDAMTTELGRVAWIVTDAGSDTFKTRGGDVTTAKTVTQIAQNYMPSDQVAPLDTLLTRISNGQTDGKLGGFLSTWWSSAHASANSTVFATSPLVLTPSGQLSTTLAFLDFQTTTANWQSFFATRVKAATDITVRHAGLSIAWDLWTRLKDDIAAKLGKAALDSIQTIEI